MADFETGDEAQAQMEPAGFRFTETQKDELRKNIAELLLSFESDRRLIDQFLESPFDYLQQNHPISVLSEMDSKKPDLVYSFDSAIRRLRLELLGSHGNCIACILSTLALIYAFLLHFGLSVELLKSVIAEVVMALADFFGVDDKTTGILEIVVGFTTTISPLSLARRFCRRMGLCTKFSTSIDVDTITSVLPKENVSRVPAEAAKSLRKGGSFDL